MSAAPEIQKPKHAREPHNKKIRQQRRFVAIRKKKVPQLGKLTNVKPSAEEKRAISSSLLLKRAARYGPVIADEYVEVEGNNPAISELIPKTSLILAAVPFPQPPLR